MNFPSKITLLAVLAILGSSVCAYAFLAPSVSLPLPGLQNITDLAYQIKSHATERSSAALLVPAARPYSLTQDNRVQKLFDRSA